MTLRRAFLASLAVLASIVGSVFWVDRPLARFLTVFKPEHALFTSSPVRLPVMTALAVAGLLFGARYLIAGRKPPKWSETAMLAGIALLAGQLLTHELLKPVFGRVPPSYYLAAGRHGFYWFHRGLEYASFPSGHATEAAAMLSVAWVSYPRWRWAYAVMMALLSLALMLGQWHYLGDIIAGTSVGIVVGTATMWAWRRR